jgi:hypothetical protein
MATFIYRVAAVLMFLVVKPIYLRKELVFLDWNVFSMVEIYTNCNTVATFV